ncbi:MAG: porin [Planctomycetia bacterium]|nr:porin [Planctomycetia bacterium]
MLSRRWKWLLVILLLGFSGSGYAQEEGASARTLEQRVAELEAELASQKVDAEKKKENDARKPSARIRALLHMNTNGFSQDEGSWERVGDVQNGTEIRRVRIGVSGSWLEQYKYKVEVDFAKAEVALKDTYVEMTDLPWIGGVKIGYYKEFINLEEVISDNHCWLIERSSINNTLSKTALGRSLGMSMGNESAQKDYTWNVGLFYKMDGTLDAAEDEPHDWGLTTRWTHLFYEDLDSGTRLHLGFGYSCKFFDEDQELSFSGKMESNDCLSLIGTENFTGTEAMHTFVPEFLWTHGRLAVHAEYVLAQLENQAYDDPLIHGGFVQVGYWLTGEHYTYVKGRGILGRVEPDAPFARMCREGLWVSGPGAWQVVYRFSWNDLSDFPLQGEANASKIGKLYNHTVGLNWHLNAYTRVMFNYILSNNYYTYGTENSEGRIHAFMGAFQLHF